MYSNSGTLTIFKKITLSEFSESCCSSSTENVRSLLGTAQ